MKNAIIMLLMSLLTSYAFAENFNNIDSILIGDAGRKLIVSVADNSLLEKQNGPFDNLAAQLNALLNGQGKIQQITFLSGWSCDGLPHPEQVHVDPFGFGSYRVKPVGCVAPGIQIQLFTPSGTLLSYVFTFGKFPLTTDKFFIRAATRESYWSYRHLSRDGSTNTGYRSNEDTASIYSALSISRITSLGRSGSGAK